MFLQGFYKKLYQFFNDSSCSKRVENTLKMNQPVNFIFITKLLLKIVRKFLKKLLGRTLIKFLMTQGVQRGQRTR